MHKFDEVGRSLRDLAVHIAITYQFLIDSSQSISDLVERVEMLSQNDLLQFWRDTLTSFTDTLVNLDLPEYKLPISNTESVEVSKIEYILAYTDHSTFHRGQLQIMLKLLGNSGFNSDYYTYLTSIQSNK